ncbi:hypothetical protein LTR37_000315 [Vermiconidia calcicola]|uniref:Uncharacterized protein n=1 Tax=Vermiconidia calcicola TaxID=1690605 RepID=A0ACC3NYI2_9PEZI|nr:hypothetical protein LTR37_000315 [Vermiconidia calcicola]
MAKHERGFVMLSTPRSSSLGSQHHRFVAIVNMTSSIAMLEVAKFAVASTRVSPGFEAEEGEAVPKKFSAGELCYELQG